MTLLPSILAGVATLAVLVLLFVLIEARDHARVRHLERMERIRIRASRVRHRLVMLAGAGEIAPADRVAFEFIHRATTMLLRFPSHDLFMSDSLCSEILEREADPGRPPRLRIEDPRANPPDRTRARGARRMAGGGVRSAGGGVCGMRPAGATGSDAQGRRVGGCPRDPAGCGAVTA